MEPQGPVAAQRHQQDRVARVLRAVTHRLHALSPVFFADRFFELASAFPAVPRLFDVGLVVTATKINTF